MSTTTEATSRDVITAVLVHGASPNTTDPQDLDLIELTAEQRRRLPAEFHRPIWYALFSPATWLCAVCWDDSEVQGWPCGPAIQGGAELARALGLHSAT